MSIIMVTGGARSGKSTFAEDLCRETSDKITYIACAKVTDDEMAERIKRHRQQRPDSWITVEKYKNFEGISKNSVSDVFLLECITTMVTNLMFDEKIDFDTCTEDVIQVMENKILEEVKVLLDEFEAADKKLIAVTNEVGMSIVPAYRLGRIYRDIAGRMNRYIASRADEVYCIISGLPIKLK